MGILPMVFAYSRATPAAWCHQSYPLASAQFQLVPLSGKGSMEHNTTRNAETPPAIDCATLNNPVRRFSAVCVVSAVSRSRDRGLPAGLHFPLASAAATPFAVYRNRSNTVPFFPGPLDGAEEKTASSRTGRRYHIRTRPISGATFPYSGAYGVAEGKKGRGR